MQFYWEEEKESLEDLISESIWCIFFFFFDRFGAFESMKVENH